MWPRYLRTAVKSVDAMSETANVTENAPIATVTRLPPEEFESTDESVNRTECPPTLTTTRGF